MAAPDPRRQAHITAFLKKRKDWPSPPSSSESPSEEDSSQDLDMDLYSHYFNYNSNKARINQIRLEPRFVHTRDYIDNHATKEGHWATKPNECQGFGTHRWERVERIEGKDRYATWLFLCAACDAHDVRTGPIVEQTPTKVTLEVYDTVKFQ